MAEDHHPREFVSMEARLQVNFWAWATNSETVDGNLTPSTDRRGEKGDIFYNRMHTDLVVLAGGDLGNPRALAAMPCFMRANVARIFYRWRASNFYIAKKFYLAASHLKVAISSHSSQGELVQGAARRPNVNDRGIGTPHFRAKGTPVLGR
ncbi:hypothetical protein [Mesorhizobium sp. M5C.F.Cr.IN.023.01.1.1]|uniref:hypothetical protein n=1 Tax=Mesorhizobium sp. M5C.F.Cr.IN.023.01.1.1 TaxID=2496768 RepID=UPI001FDFEDE6|nr:hypothetical protein [Mesorhizobium sp. M5C.F.Cr.IN.023.01.1.1]